MSNIPNRDMVAGRKLIGLKAEAERIDTSGSFSGTAQLGSQLQAQITANSAGISGNSTAITSLNLGLSDLNAFVLAHLLAITNGTLTVPQVVQIEFGTGLTLTDLGSNHVKVVAIPAGGSIYPTMVPPVPAAFTAVNMAPATTSVTSKGYMVIKDPTIGSYSLRMQTVPPPTAPWTVTMAGVGGITTGGPMVFGMFIRDSATSRMITWGFAGLGGGALNLFGFTWNSETSANAAIISTGGVYSALQPFFLRIIDDNTNYYYQASADGETFITIASSVKGAWVATPDKVGFFVSNNGGAFDFAMTTMHWVMTSP